MSREKPSDFSKKHGNAVLDPGLKEEILKKAKNGEVPCAVLFELAGTLKVSAKEVGIALDLMNFRITKCQLGLFGYQPEKKIATPAESVSGDLAEEIQQLRVDGRLACKAAWDIAARLNLPKMAVSRACEAMGVKIKPCQLGAF
jgi:hypothetical protein